MITSLSAFACWIIFWFATLPVWGVTVDEVSASNRQFAANLYKRIKSSAGGHNLVFSPFSISSALSMSLLGATHNTQTEMAALLHYEQLQGVHIANRQLLEALRDPSNNYTLDVANGVFLSNRYEVSEEYQKALQLYYDASLYVLDFVEEQQNATDTINAWVRNQTQDHIKGLFHAGAMHSNVVLLLINAIYFKGWWKFDFDPKETRKAQFRINDNEMQEMDFMKQIKRLYYWKSVELDARILELPYVDDEVSMYIILPNSVLGIYGIEAKLDFDKLNQITSRNNRIGALLTVYLPKFKLDVKLNLKNILFHMGLKDSFMDTADFRGIGRNIYLTDVVHRATLEVTEEGTSAAAAFGIQIMLAGPTPDNEFRIDRPFVFYIQEKVTNNILFMGRMLHAPTPGTEIGEFDPSLLLDCSNVIQVKWSLFILTLIISLKGYLL